MILCLVLPALYYIIMIGARLSPIGDFCIPTNSTAKDGLDNDCDDQIDEELLNGIDDDGDGLIGKLTVFSDQLYQIGESLRGRYFLVTYNHAKSDSRLRCQSLNTFNAIGSWLESRSNGMMEMSLEQRKFRGLNYCSAEAQIHHESNYHHVWVRLGEELGMLLQTSLEMYSGYGPHFKNIRCVKPKGESF